MKHLPLVLIVCWFSVIGGNTVGHVVPQHSQLLLKTNGNTAELYDSISNGGSWLQALLLFARKDPTGVSGHGTSKLEVLTSEAKTTMKCCPNEFVTLGEHCYYFSLTSTNWKNALQFCKSLGSDLAHPMSAVENRVLVNYLRSYHKGSNVWFIGGTDEGSEGEWVWAHSNTSIELADWIYGQPDNHLKTEHCMCYLEAYEWKWSDEQCNRTFRYICQH